MGALAPTKGTIVLLHGINRVVCIQHTRKE